MAQNSAPATRIAIPLAFAERTANTLGDSGHSIVGTAVLSTMPTSAEIDALRKAQTTSRFADPGKAKAGNQNPGKTSLILIGALIAGSALALILAFSANGDDRPEPPPPVIQPAAVGTILSAGPPRVNPPTQ
jgi:hypothetical protein